MVVAGLPIAAVAASEEKQVFVLGDGAEQDGTECTSRAEQIK